LTVAVVSVEDMNAGPALHSLTVSTQWLADYLGADKLVVLDASVVPYTLPGGRSGQMSGHELYLLDGHVPGAFFADVIRELSAPDAPFPVTRPSAERFASAVGALGIDNSTTVVVYDSGAGQWASRVWWLFRSFGHNRVAVVDGGFAKWKQEERPVETGHVEPPVTSFEAEEHPEFWVDKTYVESVLAGETEAVLVSASPAEEFSGATSPFSRPGHIPGSVSVPAIDLLDSATGEFQAPAQLRRTLAPVLTAARNVAGRRGHAGHETARRAPSGADVPIVVYCGGGIDASADAFALTMLGERAVAVYDGSLMEWTADPNAQLAVSA